MYASDTTEAYSYTPLKYLNPCTVSHLSKHASVQPMNTNAVPVSDWVSIVTTAVLFRLAIVKVMSRHPMTQSA